MDKIGGLLEYFKGLIDCLYDQFFSLNDKHDITSYIYEYILNEDNDFSEFDKDFFNCQDYQNIDRKECLKNIMYAIYFILKFYYEESKDLYENIFLDDCSSTEIENNMDELFEMENFGIDMVDKLLLYFEYPEAKRKKIAVNSLKNEEFMNLFFNNDYVLAILDNDINLEVPEVAIIVDDIVEIYDDVNPDKIFDVSSYASINDAYTDIQSDYKDLKKVRKKLLAKSLAQNCDIQTSMNYMKHLFSIILKSCYINIYNKKVNDPEDLTKSDFLFFNLINTNEIEFDEIFYKFMHDDKFSAYLIGGFCLDNIDKNIVDFEEDEEIYQKNNLDEKVKKYYI